MARSAAVQGKRSSGMITLRVTQHTSVTVTRSLVEQPSRTIYDHSILAFTISLHAKQAVSRRNLPRRGAITRAAHSSAAHAKLELQLRNARRTVPPREVTFAEYAIEQTLKLLFPLHANYEPAVLTSPINLINPPSTSGMKYFVRSDAGSSKFHDTFAS